MCCTTLAIAAAAETLNKPLTASPFKVEVDLTPSSSKPSSPLFKWHTKTKFVLKNGDKSLEVVAGMLLSAKMRFRLCIKGSIKINYCHLEVNQ